MLNIFPNCHLYTFILGMFATKPHHSGSLYPKNIGMKGKQIVNIKKIAFTKLQKLEVFTLYNAVVDIVSKHDTKAMHIYATCHVLIGMKAKAQLLELSDRDLGHNHLTPKVSELHERRLKFAGIITNQMKVAEQASLKGTDHLVKMTKLVVLRHLHYLRQNDRVAVTQMIYQFFLELKENPEVKEALYELGFKPYLDELQNVNNAYLMTYDERRRYRSSKHKGSTLSVQREIQKILKILFEQVNHYQHVFSDIDYSNLIARLNNVISEYTKQIKTRDTQRKNKKLKAEENAKVALEEMFKIENNEKKEPANVANKTNVKTTKGVTENMEKITPVPTNNKIKEKEKPVNGLLDLLKNKDKGSKENGADEK